MTETFVAGDRPRRAALIPARRFRVRSLVFVAPALLVSLGLIALPLLYSMRISLYDYTLQTGVSRFVGLGN